MNCDVLVMISVLYMQCLPSGLIPEVNGVDLEVLDHATIEIIQVLGHTKLTDDMCRCLLSKNTCSEHELLSDCSLYVF